MHSNNNCGWLSSYSELRTATPSDVVSRLQSFLNETNPSQITSWTQSVPIVQRELGAVLNSVPSASAFHVVLEYVLPREGGRRPDVICLQNGVVLVLEFKQHSIPMQAHLDQVKAYARDIQNYHEQSHNLTVVPVLVPQGYKGGAQLIDSVHVLPASQIGAFLAAQMSLGNGSAIEPHAWASSEYAPLPSLIRAARMLFKREPLPRIKRALSAGVPDVVELILNICHEAAATKSRHLVLLTGAPGSGKTLVGLQVAHNEKLEDLRVKRGGKNAGAPAVFLSGNKPLVAVLQDALGSSAFVANMKKFIKEYGFDRPALIPREHVLIFDEAQRAWDVSQMQTKHVGATASEPEKLLEIACRIPEWSVVVALVGEGQEIHVGEEAGLSGWQAALSHVPNPAAWTLHGPAHALAMFSPSIPHRPTPLLNLTASLRSHLAADIHDWVKRLLSDTASDHPQLQTLADSMRSIGFQIYVTQDLEAAKAYIRERYQSAPEARYGLLASRKAQNLIPLGIDNDQHYIDRKKQLQVGPWFNAVPSDPLSCCALVRPATEFECQGLELDFPLVCWGDDLLWNGSRWVLRPKCRARLSNPDKVTRNCYRVLLTRGRDGMVIFVPPNQDSKMNTTYDFLVASGCQPLSPGLLNTAI